MMKPRAKLSVPVKVENLSAGEEAFITVAAVDVGILNLTRYNPPAPENYYFDQKRLNQGLYRHPLDDILYDVPAEPENVG